MRIFAIGLVVSLGGGVQTAPSGAEDQVGRSDPYGRYSPQPTLQRRPIRPQTSTAPAPADPPNAETTPDEEEEADTHVSVSRKGRVEPAPVARDLDSPVDFGRYFALVIGIDGYSDLPRLQTAQRDAGAVARILRENYGFEVDLLQEATRNEVISALSAYRYSLDEGDNLLIYYAGHGLNDTQAAEAYWLPVDASRLDQTAWISNSTVSQMIRAIKAKHVLVVSDSCYSGSLTRGLAIARRDPGWLERARSSRSRTVLSSGGIEPVPDAGFDGHSIFASAFVRALERNDSVLDGTTLYNLLKHRVMLESRQSPRYGDLRFAGHEDGDFLFVPTGGGALDHLEPITP
jgi:uncharacterized caspase-like protein